MKYAIAYPGIQLSEDRKIMPNSVWVLGPNLFIDRGRKILDAAQSDFVWLGHLHTAPGLPGESAAVSIMRPLGSSALVKLIDAMQTILRHNYIPGLLTLGAGVMALHYAQLQQKRGHCHVPILWGNSQTGKTTALQCALSLYGCHRNTFYSRGTKEGYLQKCYSSTLPVGCDDPQSPATIGQMIVELFNGAKSTLVKSGDRMPLTTCMISANFNLAETVK